ncbi:MAG: TRAP transporter permease [Parvibaculaceae bacterium]
MSTLRITDLITRTVAVSLSLFAIYTAYFGTFYPYIQRSIPLLLTVVLALLTIRASPEKKDSRVPIYDWLMIAAAVVVFGYVALYSDYFANRWPMSRMSTPATFEIVFGIVAVGLILEAVRRTIGWTLVVITLLMFAYVLLGDRIPWQALSHGGFSLTNTVDYFYMTIEGIWGECLAIAATYITLFIIFGAFMEKGGATEFFLDLSNAIAGESRGGPAKVTIFGSALVGSVTGSTVANVYAVGPLTIPLMKKVGYRPSFAAAVEALASNGGQLMPPIMGAAAFILAANVGMPYWSVAVAGIIPALLYFGALLWYIHLEAVKRGLKGLPKGSTPRVLSVLFKRGYLLLPLFLLMYLLARGYSPMLAGFYAIVAMVALSWLRKETRIGPKECLEALESGGRSSVMIMVVCAAVGIVIGTFTQTGLGLSLTSVILSVSGGSFVVLTLLVFVAALIMGTGLNTVASYILVAVIGVPAMQAHGVDVFTANMFVFYVATLSHITPPVALACFAGAAIAEADIWETSFLSMRLGIVAYLLPFLAVFAPGMLLVGSGTTIIVDTCAAVIACGLLVSVTQNWMFGPMLLPLRGLAIGASVALLWPVLMVKGVGLGLAVLSVVIAWAVARHQRQIVGIDAAPREVEESPSARRA